MQNVTRKARDEGMKLLEAHRRPVWIPAVGEGDPGPTASKYFGSPWMAAGEEWPRVAFGTEPMRFVLQLDVATLPEPMSALLGGQGLLQLFYNAGGDWWPDSKDDGWIDRLSVVRLVRPDLVDGGAREQPPVRFDPIRRPRAIRGWDEGTDLPHRDCYGDLGLRRPFRKLEREYGFDVVDVVDRAYQGDKLGGWPCWTVTEDTPFDRRGLPMALVYQLDAGEFHDGLFAPSYAPSLFAANGTGHIFASRTDPTELKFTWSTY
jgi:hypothetical protein